VAKIAGMPSQVIALAQRVLQKLEENDINNNIQSILGEGSSDILLPITDTPVMKQVSQLTFFANDAERDAIIDALRKTDLMQMTPLEAMNFLNDLQRKARTY